MALGAMMVAGSAAPAAAASQVDFSGYYRAHFMNDYNLTYGNKGPEKDTTRNDSFFVNRLHLDFTFRPTDELAVFWALRAPSNQRWGNPANGGRLGAGAGNAVETRFVYGEIKQDWGTIDIGHLSTDFLNIGLNSLGYWPGGPDPVAFTVIDPFDFDVESDGIRYSNRWDNGFQFVAQYNRLATSLFGSPNNTALGGNGLPAAGLHSGDDNNSDLFITEGAYFWDGGGASLALLYQRDAATNATVQDHFGPGTAWFINPAVMHSWGDFSFHFEGKAGWGRQKHSLQNQDTWAWDRTAKNDGLGLYLDFDYNYGPGNVNLAGWWTSGTDLDDNDPDGNNLVSMGSFYPLLVAYNGDVSGWGRYSQNAVNVANARAGRDDVTGRDNTGAANHWAIDLSGAHAFNDDISLTYALAYLALDNTAPGASKSIGTEVDLGLQIQLLDNLMFTTSAGYLFTGKAFDGYDRPLANGGSVPVMGGPDFKAKDAYTWYNTLTFSF